MINVAIVASGILLVVRLLYTYNDPVPVGALFILLICIKSFVEIWKGDA